MDIVIYQIELLPIKNHIVIPRDIGGWEFTDHIYYGDSNNMNFFLSFYESMQFFYGTSSVDASHATEFPRKYLISNGLEYLIDEKIKYSII
jgi:hypothetical protein